MKSMPEWTAEQIIAELRRRERLGLAARATGKERSIGPTAPTRDMSTHSTAELATMAQNQQRVIYGVDNRQDLYQVKNGKVRKAAAAVAALVEKKDLTAHVDGGWQLKTTPYQKEYKLCSSETFATQPLGCFCSGFLVRPDVVATAGHCVTSTADLAHVRFVFGFRMKNGKSATTVFGPDDVYEGAELVGRRMTSSQSDWALVRLSRPVVGRSPVSFRTAGKIAVSQALFVIGHPCGLPLKFADGAAVRDNSPKPFFVANLDTYGGNSGSPVFNAKNYQVEGILVRGENDFVKNGTCHVSLVCPTTGCRGEDVTRATEWSRVVPKPVKRRKRKGGRARSLSR
jgi:trypsin-like peptidase